MQRTTQLTAQRTTQLTTNWEECGLCPVFASYTLAFALQLTKEHEKTSVRGCYFNSQSFTPFTKVIYPVCFTIVIMRQNKFCLQRKWLVSHVVPNTV